MLACAHDTSWDDGIQVPSVFGLHPWLQFVSCKKNMHVTLFLRYTYEVPKDERQFIRYFMVERFIEYAAITQRPLTTHPLVWAESHNYTSVLLLYLCQVYLPDTIAYHSTPQFPQDPRLETEDGIGEHMHYHHNIDSSFISKMNEALSELFIASRCE